MVVTAADRVPFAERRLVLEAVVFMSAAVGMVLELAGSRLMAPYFGNSLFVWTSLIGVILAFMSLGNYLGGRLADRWIDATMLSWALGFAALGVALTSALGVRILPFLVTNGPSRLMTVIAACILFAVPSVLLGVISPYSIRIRIHGMEHAGATVGSLYAIGTIGSIAGTFAAGFWLLAIMGTRSLILLCVLVLAVLSAVLMGRLDWRKLVLLAVVALIVAGVAVRGDGRVVTIDTHYDHYLLREGVDPATGRPIMGLSRDMVSAESASYMDTGEPYPFDYYGYYDLASALRPEIESVLMIGGGTFSYPRLFLQENPQATIDVVEIDADLVAVASEYFGYVPDQRMSIFLEDGRTFLNRAQGPYDAILVDAFKSEATVPYQLTTVETWRRCYELLDDRGLLVMNVVASPEERVEFFDALYASISAVFPHVEAYAVQGEYIEGALSNTSIIAAKAGEFDLAAALAQVAPDKAGNRLADYEPPPTVRVLTDDFAPVDQYLLRF